MKCPNCDSEDTGVLVISGASLYPFWKGCKVCGAEWPINSKNPKRDMILPSSSGSEKDAKI